MSAGVHVYAALGEERAPRLRAGRLRAAGTVSLRADREIGMRLRARGGDGPGSAIRDNARSRLFQPSRLSLQFSPYSLSLSLPRERRRASPRHDLMRACK